MAALMRVALDVRPLQYPGAHRGIARYVQSLLPALARQALELFLLAEPDRSLPPEMAAFPRLAASPRRLPPRQMGWLADEWLDWNRLPVDVIHLTSPFDLSFGWPLRCRLPQVMTIYDFFALELPLPGWRRLGRPIYRWMAWKLQRARHLVCISNQTRERAQYWLRRCPPATVTPLGVSPLPAAGTLPEGCPERFLLLFPCWPRHKNVESVVRALGSDGPPLVIAGDCPEDFRRHLHQPNLFWTGRLPDAQLSALYQQCTGFVFPSLHEGFGLTVLEAMSQGAPVAVSDRAPMNEVVTRPESLFDPNDPSSIRQACDRLWEGPSRSDWSRQRAAQYTWDETARLTVQAYEASRR